MNNRYLPVALIALSALLAQAPARADQSTSRSTAAVADDDEGDYAADSVACQRFSGGRYLRLCRQARSDERDHVRYAKVAALAASLPKPQAVKLEVFLSAADRYCDARGEELKPLGSMFDGILIADAAAILDDLVAALDAFNKGRLPHFSHEEAARAEQALAEALALKVQAQQSEGEHFTREPEDSRKVQPIWQAFREAGVSFGLSAYPSVKAYEWQAYFAQKRTETLEEQH